MNFVCFLAVAIRGKENGNGFIVYVQWCIDFNADFTYYHLSRFEVQTSFISYFGSAEAVNSGSAFSREWTVADLRGGGGLGGLNPPPLGCQVKR